MSLTVTDEGSKTFLPWVLVPGICWGRDTMFVQRESSLQIFCLEEAIISFWWLIAYSMAYCLFHDFSFKQHLMFFFFSYSFYPKSSEYRNVD